MYKIILLNLFIVQLVAACVGPAAVAPPSPTPTVTTVSRSETPVPPTETPMPTATYTRTPIPTATDTPSPSPSPTFVLFPTVDDDDLVFPTPTLMATRVFTDTARVLPDLSAYAFSLAWSPDGKYLFIGLDEGGLVAYNVQENVLNPAVGNDLTVQSLAMSPAGKVLAAGLAEDGSIRLLDAVSGYLSTTIWPAHEDWVQALDFSPDGSILASGGDDGRVLLWDPTDGSMLRELYSDGGLVWGLSFSPDGSRLVAAFQFENVFRIWETQTWTLIAEFPGDQGADLAFSPDGSRFVTAGGTFHEANLWHALSGELVFNLREMPGWVYAVDYDPKGQFIAAGGIGTGPILWDPATGLPAGELYLEGDFIQDLAFNPSGTLLASAGAQVVIWEMARWR